MERFDHSEEEEGWEALAPARQEFYRARVRKLLRERKLVVTALG